MTDADRTEHRAMLAEFRALWRAVQAENWHPRAEPPLPVQRWLSVGHILLIWYAKAVENNGEGRMENEDSE